MNLEISLTLSSLLFTFSPYLQLLQCTQNVKKGGSIIDNETKRKVGVQKYRLKHRFQAIKRDRSLH